jgi:nucleoid DNA-binding protein
VIRRPLEKRGPYERLVLQVAQGERITQKLARAVIERFIACLPDAVWARGRFVVPGLGCFRVRARKQRRIANPQALTETMVLPATRLVACRVAKSWRRRNG